MCSKISLFAIKIIFLYKINSFKNHLCMYSQNQTSNLSNPVQTKNDKFTKIIKAQNEKHENKAEL